MGTDRIIRTAWKRPPDRQEVEWMITDYFNDAQLAVRWTVDRWFCWLPGRAMSALYRVRPEVGARDRARYTPEGGFDQRVFEVIPMDACVYVTTRQADDFTNAVAMGLAEAFARFYGTEVEL